MTDVLIICTLSPATLETRRAALLPRLLVFPADLADIGDETPDLIVRVNAAEGRHSGQAYAVLDDPEELLIRPSLCRRSSKVGRTQVHPLSKVGR